MSILLRRFCMSDWLRKSRRFVLASLGEWQILPFTTTFAVDTSFEESHLTLVALLQIQPATEKQTRYRCHNNCPFTNTSITL